MIETNKILAKRFCWNCHSEMDDLYFCSRCASLQRLPEGIDYFTCFGLGPQLKIDLECLEAKFYGLSRKFHPDFYQGKSQEEQAISLENAAVLNKAYRTLKDPLKRVEYLISLAEGGGIITTESPADLFDEIFELQEVLEDFKAIPSTDVGGRISLLRTLNEAKEKFQRRQDGAQKQLERLSDQWDNLERPRQGLELTGEQKRCLGEMKKVLSHRAYLERILNDICIGIERG